MQTASKTPILVCVSDLHFSILNLKLSTRALVDALAQANASKIPLVISGDLHDTKAMLRAEVVNQLILILSRTSVPIYILVGNHDKINEKSDSEEHGLHYLKPYAKIVDRAVYVPEIYESLHMIPYQSSPEDFLEQLKGVPAGSLLIMHQGVKGAWMGDYLRDTSSVDPAVFSNIKVFSGHYHRHQTIENVTYVGNPFTMSFGEANDPNKGFLTIYSDGSFDRHILGYRKHVIIEKDLDDPTSEPPPVSAEDLVWLKLHGSREKLDVASRDDFFVPGANVKLEKIYKDAGISTYLPENKTDFELFDEIIDNEPTSEAHRGKLKDLWRVTYEAHKV